MKKALKRITSSIYFYKEDERIEGKPTHISGDLTGISGNLSGISGNLTGISGNLSGVRGDLDDCYITDQDREDGINITDLIE